MKNWIKILITILIMAVCSVGLFFILRACGIADTATLQHLIEQCGAWGWLAYIILFILCTNLLCFVPVISAAFVGVSILLFGPIKGFIASTIAVFLGSMLMFWLGDKFGEKVAIKIVGKEDLEKAQQLIDVKSRIFLPLMFLFPIFPDDALCLVAGMTKMKYWYFAIITLIFRTTGIATICFLGGGIIDWSKLNWVEWFCLINLAIFDIVLIFRYSNKLEKKILEKNKENKKEVKQIPFKFIVKIQVATIKIFEALDEDYPDYRIVRANERAIYHYLSLITDDKNEQDIVLKTIENENFNTKDGTYKPICDNLRKLGYEVINGK